MPGLSFLSKKSWHTSNLSNQEKVWIAEQKAESEARKVAELREQIKVEREREEFDRLTKGDAAGDRGINWMYEGGGTAAAAASAGVGGGAVAAREEEEEARRNEAYLLGKEYVPEGGARHSGDFVEASTMTGALEKASTRGATIGAGYADDGGGGSTRLRIREDAATTSSAASAAAAGDGGDEDRDWSQNFHLRHEDPMFAVHQRRQARLKDAEKTRRLLERAGLDVSVPAGGDKEDRDRRKEDASEGDDDDDDDGRQGKKRKRRGKSEKKKKKRSMREEAHRRRRHSKSKRDEHKLRNNDRDDNDGSSSSSPSHSSSSASVLPGRHRWHRDGRKGQRVHSPEYDGRRRRRVKEDDHDDRRRDRDSSGRRGKRRRNRSGSRERMRGGEDDDYHGDRRPVRDCDERDGPRRVDGCGDSRNRYCGEGLDDRKRAPSTAPSPPGTFNNDDRTGSTIAGGTRGRYGLVGTSLSNDNDDGTSATRHQPGRDRRDGYLGPERGLLESKRRAEAEERERALKSSRKGDRW
jgi:hypothetical protein